MKFLIAINKILSADDNIIEPQLKILHVFYLNFLENGCCCI